MRDNPGREAKTLFESLQEKRMLVLRSSFMREQHPAIPVVGNESALTGNRTALKCKGVQENRRVPVHCQDQDCHGAVAEKV